MIRKTAIIVSIIFINSKIMLEIKDFIVQDTLEL